MKLATYRIDNAIRIGRWDGVSERLHPLLLAEGSPATDLLALIRGEATRECDESHALADVELLAPIPLPARNIFCVGKNYRNHAREFSQSGFDASHGAGDGIPEYPIIFTKTPQTVIAHGATVWSAEGVTDALDYEAELAVIIGQGGRGISKANAAAHVWGYTIVNDVTARDWQKRHGQWDLGKSFDTFCPMGPFAVSADEIDGGNLDLSCWINGELRQHANTRDLIFDIPTLIETISAGITLYPGDIIATGTPEGVGIGFTPPKFLRTGDVMRIEIEGIGRLENRIA
ncbi:MAG TPA: fumarylacetoacetate hydrolase family protein [Luteibacter sp.]|jgi:2-keto-4-pentenoate hydratase/2-oxohepta-3-ene-1,7-dioic acid hydratase in catechol pathway|nr:fumarylacetoacetate hydrolase family protein [Luteibacter sp.]